MQLPLIGKVKNPSSWVIGLLAAGILAAGSTTAVIMGRATPKLDLEKLTVPVQSQNLNLRIAASGTVVPVQSVNLSPKTAGRLAELYVEQGDQVKQGQKIALMENAELQAQLLQAKANLAQAQARLAEAVKGSRPEEISQARARLLQAQAQLSGARSSRPEEIAQAQSQVDAARSRERLTQLRAERYLSLRAQGAVSQDQLDEVLTDDRNAKASLTESLRRLEQVRNGSRPEEVAQRSAVVAESRSALEQLQNGSRPEEIQRLKAEVDSAQAQLMSAQVQLEDTLIRAPFAGVVTQKYATVGAFVTPTTSASSTTSATSTSIVAIAKDLEILAKVPEVDISQITQGQPIEILADAYPDQVFKGTVRLIAPEAVVEQNVTSFQVRVAITTGKDQLRSGMNVDLTFLGKQLSNALMIPTVAIVTEAGKTGVLIPTSENKPQFRPVTIGPSIQNQTQILEGVKEGERVFIDLPKDRRPKPANGE